MTMDKEQIVIDYRQAKKPMKQINILAQLNGCSRDEIAKILLEAGCELPGVYGRKKKAGNVQEQEQEQEQEKEEVAVTKKQFFGIYTTDKGCRTQTNSVLTDATWMEVENGSLLVWNCDELVGVYDLGVLIVAHIREEQK